MGLHAGVNTVAMIMQNAAAWWAGAGVPTAYENPTGLIYSMTVTWSDPVPATVDIKLGTLNLKSNGVFTVSLAPPEGYKAEDIDVSTVTCAWAPARQATITGDGRLVLKFNCQDVVGVSPGEAVPLTVGGALTNGMGFAGSGTVRVIDPGGGKK